jgi:hypothetical protein
MEKGVENSVVEITKDNKNQPIPMKNGIPGKLVAQLKIKNLLVFSLWLLLKTNFMYYNAVHYLVPF